jgi:hypothetical protein
MRASTEGNSQERRDPQPSGLCPGREAASLPRIGLARALELNAEAFPTRSGMLMLLETWLFIAERDGIAERQQAYAQAVRRAISAVRASGNIKDAIALLKVQEAALSQRDEQVRHVTGGN